MEILDADRPAAFRLFRRFDSEPFQKTLDSVRNQRSIVQIHFGMYRKYIFSVSRKSFQIILQSRQNRNRRFCGACGRSSGLPMKSHPISKYRCHLQLNRSRRQPETADGRTPKVRHPGRSHEWSCRPVCILACNRRG